MAKLDLSSRVTITRRDLTKFEIDRKTFCNLISFMGMVISDMWQNGTTDVEKAIKSLDNPLLYCNVPDDMKQHVIDVVLANRSAYETYNETHGPII